MAERPKVLLHGAEPIPRTHTGKVQRRKLQTWFAAWGTHRGVLVIAERTAKTCLLAPDAVVDLPRVLELADRAVTGTEKSGGFRYFVENDALGLFEVGDLLYMPRDCFAFAVGVCRKYYFIGEFCFALQFINNVLFFFDDEIARHKTTFDIDGVFVAFGQITNVSDRSTHGKTLTEIFFDRFRFCR